MYYQNMKARGMHKGLEYQSKIFSNLRKGIVFLFCLIFLSTYAGAEGDIESLRDFDYWDNGKIRQCTVYNVYGRLKAKAFCRYDGTVEKIEKYDKYGNKIEEILYDGSGKLKKGIDGWAAMRWWYDGSQLVSQISYDEYGRPIERKSYSESGKLISRQYMDDDNLDPYEEANMALLLGQQNVRYYDPTSGRIEEDAELIRK